MGKARVIKYSPMLQHTGTWLRGYDWQIYGCGTYREEVTAPWAQTLIKRYFDRLRRKLRCPVSYYAGLERRYSGCGGSEIRPHWHFLAAADGSEGMAEKATDLWKELFGIAKIEPYDANRWGAYYVCKLAVHQNGHVESHGLERLGYHGPSDLIAAARSNPYVPDHLKDKVFGEFLRVTDADPDTSQE